MTALNRGRSEIDVSDVENALEAKLVRAMDIAAKIGTRRAEEDLEDHLSLDLLSDVLGKIKKPKKRLKGVLDLRAEFRKLAKTAGAKSIKLVTDKLQDRMSELVAQGLHVKQGRRELSKVLKKAGASGADDHLLNTLFRTYTQVALNGAHWNNMEQSDFLWGYMYSTAGDERVRDTHAALDGTVLPIGHKLWKKIAPPNGWNCRCYLIPLYDPEPIVKPKKGWDVDSGFATNWGNLFSTVS